jgi:magnesium chelatase subunit I
LISLEELPGSLTEERLANIVSKPGSGEKGSTIRSLRELIDQVTGRGQWKPVAEEDSGLVEQLPFPFLAIVGQKEMKLALLLAIINPLVGGVLLIGPRGTGKTTAARSLVNLLPQVPRSICYYGCMPEDIELGGIDAVCPDCARKYGQGDPLAVMGDVRLVELPLNARLEDVIGGVDERASLHDRMRVKRGILAQADRNLLYIDEVNLLSAEVVDAILDAAAQGQYTIRRGPVSATYRARFILIGSMNPEEGHLRPQILDRFGLRVIVSGSKNLDERLEAYYRTQMYLKHPRKLIQDFSNEMELARAEVQVARDRVSSVILPENVAKLGLDIVNKLEIDSLRAEITLYEAARAYTAMDNRTEVSIDDLQIVAPLALRMRQSAFMKSFLIDHAQEEKLLIETIAQSLMQLSK